MKLYFAPRTRAIRARWLLEELGVPYELVRLDLSKEENRTPDSLALSPLGELPVLVDGEVTLFESVAVCLHLADRFPERNLAPPPGSPERGDYLQWLVFAEMTLEAALADPSRSVQRPPVDAILSVVEARVAGREFIAGSSFSAADVVMASVLHRAHTQDLLGHHAPLMDYVRRHTGRPASRRAVLG